MKIRHRNCKQAGLLGVQFVQCEMSLLTMDQFGQYHRITVSCNPFIFHPALLQTSLYKELMRRGLIISFSPLSLASGLHFLNCSPSHDPPSCSHLFSINTHCQDQDILPHEEAAHTQHGKQGNVM